MRTEEWKSFLSSLGKWMTNVSRKKAFWAEQKRLCNVRSSSHQRETFLSKGFVIVLLQIWTWTILLFHWNEKKLEQLFNEKKAREKWQNVQF
jgi:hypothetical protein